MTTGLQAVTPVIDLAELARLANEEHQQCEAALQSGLAHALAAGDYLLQAKALVQHGDWLPWVEANFEASERTAQAYMRVSRELPEAQRVADLPFREAVRLLAAPSESPAAQASRGTPSDLQADIQYLEERLASLDGLEGEEGLRAALEIMEEAEVIQRRTRYEVEISIKKLGLHTLEVERQFPGLMRRGFEATGADYGAVLFLMAEGRMAETIGISPPPPGGWRKLLADVDGYAKWMMKLAGAPQRATP